MRLPGPKPPFPNSGEGLYGISYGDAEWVAVGDAGTILTTTVPASRTWDTQASGTSANLRDIIYNGTDRYVVVGVGGLIITSPDARVWTSSPSGTNVDLVGVEYDAGLYVAVGTDGTILSSSDGISWTPQTSGTIQNLRDVGVGKSSPSPALPLSPASIPTLPLPLLVLLPLLMAGTGAVMFRRKQR